jgi:hypothetical protein
MTTPVYQRAGDFVDQQEAIQTPFPDTLYGMAEALLARMEVCFLGRGLTLPSRKIIYMSPIVQDCEQAAVVFSGWTPTPVWDGTIMCDAFRWLANFSCLVTRCTPALPGKNGTTPAVAKMNDAARLSSADAEAMLCVVATLGELGPELQVITHAPQGGLQTVELLLNLPAAGAV